MRVLFCSQFYAPSIGGVQEVIRQIAERLVVGGCEVTVATTRLPARDFSMLNGVVIRDFDVTGNLVSGMSGAVKEYQEFVLAGKFDVMMVIAAQQWTFDALWPILDNLSFQKVLFPCGFSGLYEPGYVKYFQALPEVLYKFDHLVFNATQYRDIEFARRHGICKLSIIPVGASEEQFNVAADIMFRSRHGIPDQSFLFLTVGSFTGLKGHVELVRAFSMLSLPAGQHATLILNGNEVQTVNVSVAGLIGKFVGLIRIHGLLHIITRLSKMVLGTTASPKKIADHINKTQTNKKVLVTNFPRDELTQAFMAADLFVFASNIEYSPLVLFESAAAGTPFLSVDVGNAVEIAQWTGSGVICPSSVDKRGYTRVDVAVLSKSMAELMHQRERLDKLGASGRRNWLEKFTWEKIAAQYKQLFVQLTKEGLVAK